MRTQRKLVHESWMRKIYMRDPTTGAQYNADDVEWLGLDEDGDGHVKARNTGVVYDCAEHAWQGWRAMYDREAAEVDAEAERCRAEVASEGDE